MWMQGTGTELRTQLGPWSLILPFFLPSVQNKSRHGESPAETCHPVKFSNIGLAE